MDTFTPPPIFKSCRVGFDVWCGVGCQIRRQAEHGAAHNLAIYLEAAELIPRPAAVNADILF